MKIKPGTLFELTNFEGIFLYLSTREEPMWSAGGRSEYTQKYHQFLDLDGNVREFSSLLTMESAIRNGQLKIISI